MTVEEHLKIVISFLRVILYFDRVVCCCLDNVSGQEWMDKLTFIHTGPEKHKKTIYEKAQAIVNTNKFNISWNSRDVQS